jgi:hypothetical protein
MSLESLAHSLQGNLTYNSHDESAWDRLTALAWGSVTAEHRSARESLINSLGVSLIAFKHARREDLRARTAADLRDCLAWRLKSTKEEFRWKLACLAIEEWIDDNCPTCTGAGHVYDNVGVQRSCPKCGGSRKRRYTDQERAESLRVADGAKWGYAMDVAHAQLALAVATAARQAQERLQK